jgi:threonine synthase
MSLLTHLECSRCGATYDAGRLWNVCPADGKPLLARYDLQSARRSLDRDRMREREPSLWRWRELLPVRDPARIVTLGEGGTPLLRARGIEAAWGLADLRIKEEGLNPTGSFKARGMAVAVSRARELGATALAVPSAGNAGGALAAYAARAGLPAHLFMPCDVPRLNVIEAVACGAKVTLVDGLISDCGRIVRERAADEGWFDLSTLREPYRVEGKKTLGYELAVQLDWELPDVILYPTGGGTGLVGMAKAFDELEALGWIGPRRPRMVAVQAEGCAPIARAFHAGWEEAPAWENATTAAAGIRVPAAIGDFLMLRILRDTGGTALTVSEAEIAEALRELGEREGLFACPEGAATLAALRRLLVDGTVNAEERIVLFNTGTGLKYEGWVEPGEQGGRIGSGG